MEIGFFPDVVLENITPQIFFRQYLDLVIYRDIIERYAIRNEYALEFLIKSAISSNTKEFSIRKIYNTLETKALIKASKKTKMQKPNYNNMGSRRNNKNKQQNN